MSDFKVVRVGFDTIVVSFSAHLPIELCDVLIDARDRARDARSDEPIELGPGQVRGEVLSHGVQGGYDAVFSTGELGELWYFKTAQNNDPWRLRMKIRAGALLAHGYRDAVERALKRLRGFDIRIDDTRMSEVHVCIDVQTDAAFRLQESQLLRPGKAIVRPWEVLEREHPLMDGDIPAEVQRVLRGNRLQTLAIGSRTTGSQTVIYDKRAEATLKRNWLVFEAYKLDRRNRDWGLWRVEIRFSGPVLKQRFGVRKFADLEAEVRAMADWATNRVRYVAQGQEDIHPTRRALAPFWEVVQAAIPELVASPPSMIPPSAAQHILDRQKKETLESTVVGAAVARAAMDCPDAGKILKELPSFVAHIASDKLRDSPDRIRESAERAVDRNSHAHS